MLKTIAQKILNICKKTLSSFYITTTLPYVNATPHVGHALEFVRADVIARYKKLRGLEVFFNTGTDEHGQKLYEAAQKAGLPVQKYVDQNSLTFKNLLTSLGITDAHFIRTTDLHHITSAQKFWEIANENGYIYKNRYQAKYCVGCELEKTDSDLVNGRCPDHPNLELQLIDEENYFFKFSAFQKPLLELFEKNPQIVIPEIRYNEAKKFIEKGLKDFSISRLKSKMPWGIQVPNDDEHVMYVWFDALVNYISTLGWPEDQNNFQKFWNQAEKIQYCGQDNLRQQSIIWQAMLMSVGILNTDKIIIDGFVTGAGGIKMSKTIGNVIDPIKLIGHYGTDAFRLYVVKDIHPWDGSPVTYDSYFDSYNADLVNGIGNLTSRVLTMTEKNLDSVPDFALIDKNFGKLKGDFAVWAEHLDNYRIDLASELIFKKINNIDQIIATTEPFKLIKTDPKKAKQILSNCLVELYEIALMFTPIMPETSAKIIKYIRTNKKPESPLFPRLEKIN